MPFFAKKKSDGSVEPVASLPPETFEDTDLASVTRRRDQAFKRLGELQFAATTRGSSDHGELEKVIREIQFLDDQIKLIYDRRLKERPSTVGAETCACGAPLTSDDVFCRNCGNRRTSTAGGGSSGGGAVSQCNVCRQRVKPGSVFCAFCGARLNLPPSSGDQNGPPSPARSFGFQMSAPLPQNGMRDAGLGEWHEGHAPTHQFAGGGAHVPMPPSHQVQGQIRNQWGRHLEEIVNPSTADPGVFLRRGVQLARENQLIEATEQFEQASKLAPRDPMPRYHLGLVRYRMGDLDGAIGEFERALRINPNFPDAHNDLGLVLTKKGQVREAIHHFRKALQIQPQHPDAHYNLGYACLAMGDPVGAATHLDMYLRIAPNAPDARAVGEMLMRLRQQARE